MNNNEGAARIAVHATAELLARIQNFCPQRTSETFTAELRTPDGRWFKVKFTITPKKG